MTTIRLQQKIARAIELKRTIAAVESELKDIKADLLHEAESDDENQRPTEGGGWSWEAADAAGNVARVTRPGPKLKAKLDPESATFGKVRDIVQRKFSFLFRQVPSYQPLENFRDLAFEHLDSSDAKRVIKLMSGESSPTVAFEVAANQENA